MKLRIIGFFILAVVTLSAIISACGSSNNSPSAPAAPAATATFTITNTPCLAGGNTCTPTFTFTHTATNTPSPTATSSPTSTPSNSPTQSPTKTFTTSPTPSPTNTPTNSPTNSPTPTPTNTVCSDGLGNTCTFTPTSANTNTATPSPTPTPTNTTCSAPAATNTPNAATYSMSGTLTDSSNPTINSSHPLAILFLSTGSSSGQPPIAFVNTNGGSYGPVGISPSGNYIPVYWYNTVGDGHNSNIHVGDYAAINGTATGILSNGTPVNINGNLTGQNFSFSDTLPLYGYSGTISYTGTGSVSYCRQLHVDLYKPNSVTASNSSTAQGSSGANNIGNANSGGIYSSGVRYDAIPYKSSSTMGAAQNVDVLAYYDLSGNYNISTGDPYVLYTNVSTSLATTNNITLNNSSSTW